MHIQIYRDALDLVFRTLLSCECPVTESEERNIFQLLTSSRRGDAIDYERVLKVFKPDQDTVFRRLHDFAIWSAPADSQVYIITRDHVIRHFSSTFHWNQVVAQGMSGAYKKVLHIPSWFLGHMLLPVRITRVEGEVMSAAYEYEGGRVILHNLFSSSVDRPKCDETWAAHFAGLLALLTPEECRVVHLMTEMNSLLVRFRHDVKEIDYTNYERHGNYLNLCKTRCAKYFPAESRHSEGA
jgi:hypothetical protein